MVYLNARPSNTDRMQESNECMKPFLSFSIERILHGQFHTEREKIKRKQDSSILVVSANNDMTVPKFNWLGYTRYNPPRLPKSSKRRPKQKRKPGRNPRVPFTPKQLTTLESKFQMMKYLTNDDVRRLCSELTLPENKIKIWFQNRRAREKRKSSQSSEEFIDVTTIDAESSS